MSYYWYRVYLVGPCVPVKQEFIQEIGAKGTSGQDKLSEKIAFGFVKLVDE